MTDSAARKLNVIALLAGIVVSWPMASRAQPPLAAPAAPAQDLAKELANPISSLVSVPFQFNWEQNVGPNEATRFVLNVQPVMPFALNKDWNLIMRVIVPLVSQPALAEGGQPAFGVSDVLTSFFVSPSRGGLIWGVGPAISLPSTTIPSLGTEKWSAGPTVVALKQTGPVTAGVDHLVFLGQHDSRGRQPDVPSAVPCLPSLTHVDDHPSIRDHGQLGS